MCGGSPPDAPEAPPAAPEAAQTPVTPSSSKTPTSNDARRRAAASGQGSSTILTSSRGVTDSGSTAIKTLLGQ